MNIAHGEYQCQRCHELYRVNEADNWNPCTPDFCQECLAHLNKQYAQVQQPATKH